MICLIRSELKKVWGRKSFPGLMALLIFLMASALFSP